MGEPGITLNSFYEGLFRFKIARKLLYSIGKSHFTHLFTHDNSLAEYFFSQFCQMVPFSLKYGTFNCSKDSILIFNNR